MLYLEGCLFYTHFQSRVYSERGVSIRRSARLLFLRCTGRTHFLLDSPPTPLNGMIWIKLSQNYYDVLPLCIACFRSWSNSIWEFCKTKHILYHLWILGHGCSISYPLLLLHYWMNWFCTTEWNWMKISQNHYCMFFLCTFHFRFWYKSIVGIAQCKTLT